MNATLIEIIEIDTTHALSGIALEARRMLAFVRDIPIESIEVKLAAEAREGKDGLRIDVLIGGKVDEEAERIVASIIGAASQEAAALMSGAESAIVAGPDGVRQ